MSENGASTEPSSVFLPAPKTIQKIMVTGAGLLFIIAAAIAFIIVASSKYKIHPFIVLLIATLFTGLATGIPLNEIATTANEGFGQMLRHIGLVVIIGYTHWYRA